MPDLDGRRVAHLHGAARQFKVDEPAPVLSTTARMTTQSLKRRTGETKRALPLGCGKVDETCRR